MTSAVIPVEPQRAIRQDWIKDHEFIILREFPLTLMTCVERSRRHPIGLIHVVIAVAADEGHRLLLGEIIVQSPNLFRR